MQKGELVVSGKGHIDIPLRRKPESVHVHFLHSQNHIPCNTSIDHLEYEVFHKRTHNAHGYILIIRWNVSELRNVKWTVAL